MPTVGERAKEIEELGVNEAKLDEYIKEYEMSKDGTIGHDILDFLLALKKRKTDFLGLTVDEEILSFEAYKADRKVEILRAILPKSEL